ncbi:MAG: DUF4097 family beta strand repeat protein [Gemmatimonadaceae bacterium]|nr:DUF4097 family beta strand repeat protein [Gemmatimonadaceae bacterium]
MTPFPSRARASRTLAAAMALAVIALATSRPLAAQQTVDRRYAVAPDLSFRVKGSIGSLRIVGWSKDSLVVTGSLPPAVQMEIGVGGDGRSPARGAKMYLESPNDDAASTGVLEIRVPARSRVWVKCGTADVEARGVDGGLDIAVIGGRVRVNASPRELQIEAMDASVAVDGTPAWLRAKTATGDITLRGGSEDLALTTVSGTIRVEQGAVERTRLESVTGPIQLLGAIARGGDVTIDSHSGEIQLVVPRTGDFAVTATSITGSVVNRFDATRPAPGREGRGAELVLERGSESARVAVRTFKGTITVTAAPLRK